MHDLTVAIPVRLSKDRKDLFERLAYFNLDTEIPQSVRFAVVDDGSPVEVMPDLEAECNRLGIKYLRIDSESRSFSVGRARNFAAQAVESMYVMFQDVDLMPYPGFYREVLAECAVQQLDRYADRFVMIGVVYLTESASREFLNTEASLRKSKFLEALLEDDESSIEKFSTGTSVTIWRRDYYLSTGGNDPDFEGWGFEDLEYACRAIRRNRRFPMPEAFQEDYRNFSKIQEYRGWKSVYRLYGDITFHKGIVMFHRWHDVEHSSLYIQGKDRNKRLFQEKLQKFAKNESEPDALPRFSKGRSLLFRDNPWVLNRWIAPNLGEIIVVSENDFELDSFSEFIKERGISRVVFHNPYANEKMLRLYNFVRENKIEFLVCERGALRDSVFLDPRGFNADSTSYSSRYWDCPLTNDESERIRSYIIREKIDDDSLEEQSSKLSLPELRAKLGLKPGRKVLFVPLQRPSDTVIKYFSGSSNGYQAFVDLLTEVSHSLPVDWDLVIKKHPLETEYPLVDGAYYANDENVKGLLELSDAVFLINSGVGVLGLIYEKPVFHFGEAFYGQDGLSLRITSSVEIISGLGSFKPDSEKVLRFLSYLVSHFYSFAKFRTRRVPWEGGGEMTATTAIEYYRVRFPGEPEMVLERRSAPIVSSRSILFDRYRNPDGALRHGKSTQRTTDRSQSSADPSIVKNAKPRVRSDQLVDSVGVFKRKFNKLRRTPALFFADSKNSLLRMVGRLFK